MAITVPAVSGKIIHIGRAGENLATTVEFDVSQWLEEFGTEGTFTLFVQQNGVGYYVQDIVHTSGAQVEADGGIVQWNVVNSNTINAGLGKCELAYAKESNISKPLIEGYALVVDSVLNFYKDSSYSQLIEPSTFYQYKDLTEGASPQYYYYDGLQYNGTTQNGNGTKQSIVVKSIIFDIVVTNSLDSEAAGEVPAPIESWLNRVTILTDKIENAEQYADSAEESAELAEQWAKGTKNGTAVVDGEAGYHDNAKYYKELVGTLATNAATSATNAANSATTASGYVTTVQGYATAASQSATLAQQWATGSTSGSPSATNNAKYYSDLVSGMTASATSLQPGSNPTASVSQVSGHYNLTLGIPKGDKGDKGDTGSGLTITGNVSSAEALPTNPPPAAGTTYTVGTSEPYDIYVYDGTSWKRIILGSFTATLVDWTT